MAQEIDQGIFVNRIPLIECIVSCCLIVNMAMLKNVLNRSHLFVKHSIASITSLRFASSAEHTIQVKKDIEAKRLAAHQGGGTKRIKGQHGKVNFEE